MLRAGQLETVLAHWVIVSVTMAVTVEIVELEGMCMALAAAAMARIAKNPCILILGFWIGWLVDLID